MEDEVRTAMIADKGFCRAVRRAKEKARGTVSQRGRIFFRLYKKESREGAGKAMGRERKVCGP